MHPKKVTKAAPVGRADDIDEDELARYQPPSDTEMQALVGDVQHDVDLMEARFHREPDDDDDRYDLDSDDDELDEELRRERDLGYSAHGDEGDGEWTEGYDY